MVSNCAFVAGQVHLLDMLEVHIIRLRLNGIYIFINKIDTKLNESFEFCEGILVVMCG